MGTLLPNRPAKRVAGWRLTVGNAIPWLLGLVVAAQLVQIYLAVGGLFGSQRDLLGAHALLANTGIRLLYLLLLGLGFVAADWRVGIAGIVLTLLLNVQYVLLAAEAPEVQALHGLNGIAMLLVAFGLFLRRLPWGLPPGSERTRQP